MASKRRAHVKTEGHLLPVVAPVVVTPKQTADEIERRRLIRESLHDATAVTVKAGKRLNQSR
jgi:hypothetical protein